jgi:hypothetical protein
LRAEACDGTRDAHGQLLFADQPTFTPSLSPQQMIARGVFGGAPSSFAGRRVDWGV